MRSKRMIFLMPAADYAFAVLKRLDWGNNKWALVFDPRGLRLWFNTDRSRRTKLVSFAEIDFSPAVPAMVFDVNTDADGDVSRRFSPYSEAVQHQGFWPGQAAIKYKELY